jgi:AcrR family transcriptional regulator
VNASIRVFARQGYADASIQDIAAEAGVAPTAVYYHFAGKEDLFDVALRRIMETVTAVVRGARADDEPGDVEALGHVIEAVWDWLDAHPDENQLLHHHLPGVTSQARVLQKEFEAIHVERGYAYLTKQPRTRNHRSAIADHATASLAVRTLNSLVILVHPLRSEEGPIARHRPRDVRAALVEVAQRIVSLS